METNELLTEPMNPTTMNVLMSFLVRRCLQRMITARTTYVVVWTMRFVAGVLFVLIAHILGSFEARADAKSVRLATTTSTVNSGLMDVLAPKFEKHTGLRLEIIAVGSGKALRLGREGKIDAVLVHAPLAEEKFVAAGYGVDRRHVMDNDFVIVGPNDDPAGIRGHDDAAEALRRIEKGKSPFVSRGDDSGTHKKELNLWKAAGIEPYGLWYHEVGKGMAGTLEVANRESSYVLIDRGTWLKLRDSVKLVLLVEGDKELFNPYGVIAVNPAKHPNVNYKGARAFIDWITSPETARLIGAYRIGGEPLFVPATSPDSN